MKNISFDNPYLLLIAIPLLLLIYIPFFIVRNKDNRSVWWTVSLIIHTVIVGLVTLAAAGLSSTSVLTKTTVYVVADVSDSSERNLDTIDSYVNQISESLPANSKVGVVCFGRDYVLLTPAGRKLKSVSEATVDTSATDIASALGYVDTLFDSESIKRVVLITDGVDTVSENSSEVASAVTRLSDNGCKIDAIFLDNSLTENDSEMMAVGADLYSTAYVSGYSEASVVIQSSKRDDAMLRLYVRELSEIGEPITEYELVSETVINAEDGLNTVKLRLPTDREGRFEYEARIDYETDLIEENNAVSFTQSVVGKLRILLVTGNPSDVELVRYVYGSNADVDSYLVSRAQTSVPVTLEQLITYDEFVLSDFDVRDLRNANAFIDSIDTAVSQYGKSLVTLGDMRLQTNSEDMLFNKLSEILPLEYGNTGRDGRLYTIVLDVSHSMFMASKFTIAKDSAIKLLSILDDDDYVCLVTFSGDISVKTPKRVGDAKAELVSYIDSLSTAHGTELALGLEEALKTIEALNLSENQVMIISDGFSFDSQRTAEEVSRELYEKGTTVSAINTYIMADGEGGRKTLRAVVNAGRGGNYYEISSPERVEGVVFGEMANDVGDVIIRKDSSVKIEKHRDGVVSGITSLPVVSGYVLSRAKFDATVPLTVTYLKDNGYQETVPLYAYRSHGNGKIASLSTSLVDSWTGKWSSSDRETLMKNILSSLTPNEKFDTPFTVTLDYSDLGATVELNPTIIDPMATVSVSITYPSGRRITRNLAFDSSKYFHSFATAQAGAYRLVLTYSYGETTYERLVNFSVPYLSEYDPFISFDTFTVSEFMRDNGKVMNGEIPPLENDESEITTYKQSFVEVLLFVAVAMLLCDIVVRKLKISKKNKNNSRTAGAERGGV